jgi:hypothetical protein
MRIDTRLTTMLEASRMVGLVAALALVAAGVYWWSLLRRSKVRQASPAGEARAQRSSQVLMAAFGLSALAAILGVWRVAFG